MPEVVAWPDAGNFASLKSCPFKFRVSAELPNDLDSVVIVPRGSKPSSAHWSQLDAFLEKGRAALIMSEGQIPIFLGATPVSISRHPEDLQTAIRPMVEEGATIITDDLNSYNSLSQYGYTRIIMKS